MSAFPFPIEYYPSSHETEIVDHFGGESAFLGPYMPGQESVRADVFLGFVNRSGSNLFAQSLASTGETARAEECFNARHVIARSAAWGVTDFRSYCRELRRRSATPEGVFCAKVGASQLFFLRKYLLIPQIFRRARYILIRRRDILAQAISYSIAAQTNAWTSGGALDERQVRYDARDISKKIRHIAESYAAFEAFFSVYDLPHHVVFYEDLVASPERVVREALRFLGLDSEKPYDPSAITLRRQTTWLNEEFERRFRLEFGGEEPGSSGDIP